MSEDTKIIAKSFDKAAKIYDEHAQLQRRVTDKLYHSISEKITADAEILDAGCGTGYFQEVLRKYGHRNDLWQVDISPAMCAIAKEYAALPEFATTHTICADINNLPFESESFDIIFSSLSLQWINASELEQVINSLASLLRSGGILALASLGDNNLKELKSLDKTLVKRFVSYNKWSEISGNISGAKIKPGEYQEVMQHKNAVDLLRSIKGVGANISDSPKLRKKSYFSNLNDSYQQEFGDKDGIPASWHIITMVGEKT